MRESGGYRPLQNSERALATLQRYGEADARAETHRPAVNDDHPLGCEERAVDERAVAGFLDVTGEQALKACDGAGARAHEIDDADVRGRDERTRSQMIHDLRRHIAGSQPGDGGRRSRGEGAGHRSASSAGECPTNESHTSVAPLSRKVRVE